MKYGVIIAPKKNNRTNSWDKYYTSTIKKNNRINSTPTQLGQTGRIYYREPKNTLMKT